MKQKTNKTYKLLIILMLEIIATSTFLGLYAWARYRSSKPGDAGAQVAKWHFDLKPGTVNGTEYANFALTRTDEFGNVAENKLAPGTYGVIPIEIDTTKTEVTMTYDIRVQIKNCPASLKFYTGANPETNLANAVELKKNKENIEENGSTISVDVLKISKYLSLDEVEESNGTKHTEVDAIHNETIYWSWPYETLKDNGVGGTSSADGDTQDTLDQGKTVEIKITAVGTEVLEKALTLGESTIKVGDTINYTKNGTEVKGIVVNIKPDEVEFMPVYTEDDVGVAEVNGNKITADYVGKAVLAGNLTLGYSNKDFAIQSWNSAEQSVNNEAKEYFNDKYGYYGASRALTVEDVNRLTGFDPTTDYSSITYNKTYTTSSASGDMRFIVDDLTMVKTTDNEVLKATELEGINVGDTVKLGNETYGGKTISEITMICTEGKSTNALYVYNNLTYPLLSKYFGSMEFVLASRVVCFSSEYGIFGVRVCDSSKVGSYVLYTSDGNYAGTCDPVVPVVSLPSNTIVKQGATSIEWNIKK